MRRLLGVPVIACAIILGACRSPDALSGTPGAGVTRSPDSEIGVARVRDGIRITNGTSRGLGYIARNPAWLGLVAICADVGPSCVRLAPGARVVVPDAEILGHSSDAREAQVTLWHVEPDPGGGYRAVIVKEVTIRL